MHLSAHSIDCLVRYTLSIFKDGPSYTKVHDYVGKADLNMGNWNPERNLGVERHSLEKINHQLI